MASTSRVAVPLQAPRPSAWETSVGAWLAVNWQTAAWILIAVLAVTTRFYDLGARAVSHDESLHMLYSYKLYNGEGYRHDPMMHGPLLFEVVAFLFVLFGDSTVVARCAVALFGVALVMLPYWFRPWLGRLGALAASAMILMSPAITQYSRHLRHDIFNEVFTILMFISLFQFLLAWREGNRTRMWRWLTVGAAAVALSLTTMEVAFIHGFIGASFVVVMAFAEGSSARLRRGIFLAGLSLFAVVGALVLWLAIGNAAPVSQGATPDLARRVVDTLAGFFQQTSGEAAPGSDNGLKTVWKLLQMLVLLAGLAFAASTLLLSIGGGGEDGAAAEDVGILKAIRSIPLRRLMIAVGLGATIFVVLYTTFFSNPYGVISGTWGSLTYWLRQHEVQRGSQPWYYYLMLMPMYEFLPLCVGLGGGLWYLLKRWRATAARPAEAGAKGDRPDAATGDAGHQPSALDNYFVGLLIYWAFANLVIYSWAGEKMPWLTVHLTLPFIFLAAWMISRAFTGLDWRQVWARQGLLFAVLLPLLGAAVIGVLSVQPFQGISLFDLRDTGQWLGAAVIALALLYAVVHYGRQLGGYLSRRVAFGVVVIGLGLLTIRFSWMLSFINYDNVSEYLFYAHGAPDLTLAMNQIEDISRRTVGDEQIKVAYDNDSTWPLEWYFRDYPNRVYYADNPTREQLDAPIVIVGPANETKVTPFLGDRYVRFNYRLVWWPIETYKDATPASIWHTYFVPADTGGSPAEQQAAWDAIRQNCKELWNVIFYRRHSTPLNQWPYVHRFYMYVRKDVLNQLWDYQIGPSAVQQTAAEPYASGFRQVAALTAIGNAGTGPGQFTSPRAIAAGPDGLLYVADSGNQRIEVLDADGNVVRTWGSAGDGPGQFQEPWGIAVSIDGRVYVADTWNHRIQVFDEQGKYLFSWGQFVDTRGQADGEPGGFWGPRDLALDAAGNVYVADTGNKRIQEFSPGGEFIAQWGGAGVIPGRFDEPTSLAFGPDGSMYVADAWNHRVQKFTSDFTPVTQWSIQGWDSDSVVNKPYLRVDGQGNVYVGDPMGYRVLVFDSQGKFLMTFGQYGFDDASFGLPLGMAFDSSGNLYVVDSSNNRVLKFGAIHPERGAKPQ